jgi:hypothetical protein
VTARVVVRRVFLAADELLRVEQLAVRASAHLVDDGRLEVEHHAARHVLARARLREERVVRVVLDADRLVRRHRAVRLNAVLKAEQFPAGVASLDTSLTNVDGNDLAHVCCVVGFVVLLR